MTPSRRTNARIILAASLAAALLVALAYGIWVLPAQRDQQAVMELLSAAPRDIPVRLSNVLARGQRAESWLHSALQDPDAGRQLRAKLPLMKHDAALVNEVAEAMLHSDAELADALADTLTPFKMQLDNPMWEAVLNDNDRQPARCLNAAAYLARCCSSDPKWQDAQVRQRLALALVADDLRDMPVRARGLHGVQNAIIAGLRAISSRPGKTLAPENRMRVFSIWEMFVRGDLDATIDLLVCAPPTHYEQMLIRIMPDSTTIAALRRRIDLPKDEAIPAEFYYHSRHMAGLTLLGLGVPQDYWPLWRHSTDPGNIAVQISDVGYPPLTKSLIVARLRATGALQPLLDAPPHLHERLFSPPLSERRHLLLALGKDRTAEIPHAERESLLPDLRVLATRDSDSGTRAAAISVLQSFGEQEPDAVAVGEQSSTHQSTATSTNPAEPQPTWSVNSLGIMLVHIPPTHDVNNRFAIASCEVARRHFEMFANDEAYQWPAMRVVPAATSADFDRAQGYMSWYDCAAFCNWLSRREGLQECFEPNANGLYAEGMRLKPDALLCSGYRMPIEQEWELAARAGSESGYCFGDVPAMAADYLWFNGNASDGPQPVGRLRPNSLGLFDVHGNVREWMLDGVGSDGQVESVGAGGLRVLRGGGFTADEPEQCSFQARHRLPADTRLPDLGLRVVRTLK